MKKRLLIICGLTATGKTSLGIKTAKKFNGEVISADSRQVYKGMDVGTGKDLPANVKYRISNVKCFKRHINYYKIKEARIWGYDLVNPDEEFNIAYFVEIASKIITDVWKRNKIPILVGGTGFYLKALTECIETLGIMPNKKLRIKLNKLPVTSLQKKLRKLDPKKYKNMNQSDINNPRRLIRAIEVAKSNISREKNSSKMQLDSVLWIGLKSDLKKIYTRIDKRVEERIKNGSEREIRRMLKKGYKFHLPSMSAMGYFEWKPYLEKEASLQEITQKWKHDEHAYTRRQLTWFKKNKVIKWFDISKPNHEQQVVAYIDEWYHGN